MSSVRMHFWLEVALGVDGVSSPSKNDLNGTIPATFKSSVGSTGISDADGMTVCPRASKKSRYVLLISLVRMVTRG